MTSALTIYQPVDSRALSLLEEPKRDAAAEKAESLRLRGVEDLSYRIKRLQGTQRLNSKNPDHRIHPITAAWERTIQVGPQNAGARSAYIAEYARANDLVVVSGDSKEYAERANRMNSNFLSWVMDVELLEMSLRLPHFNTVFLDSASELPEAWRGVSLWNKTVDYEWVPKAFLYLG